MIDIFSRRPGSPINFDYYQKPVLQRPLERDTGFPTEGLDPQIQSSISSLWNSLPTATRPQGGESVSNNSSSTGTYQPGSFGNPSVLESIQNALYGPQPSDGKGGFFSSLLPGKQDFINGALGVLPGGLGQFAQLMMNQNPTAQDKAKAAFAVMGAGNIPGAGLAMKAADMYSKSNYALQNPVYSYGDELSASPRAAHAADLVWQSNGTPEEMAKAYQDVWNELNKGGAGNVSGALDALKADLEAKASKAQSDIKAQWDAGNLPAPPMDRQVGTDYTTLQGVMDSEQLNDDQKSDYAQNYDQMGTDYDQALAEFNAGQPDQQDPGAGGTESSDSGGGWFDGWFSKGGRVHKYAGGGRTKELDNIWGIHDADARIDHFVNDAGGLSNIPVDMKDGTWDKPDAFKYAKQRLMNILSAASPKMTLEQLDKAADAMLGRERYADGGQVATAEGVLSYLGTRGYDPKAIASAIGRTQGGGHIKGAGDGLDDAIPAVIEGNTPAALSNDEFVFPADVVSALGNGSSDAGHKALYKLMNMIRQQKFGTTQQPPRLKMGLESLLQKVSQ